MNFPGAGQPSVPRAPHGFLPNLPAKFPIGKPPLKRTPEHWTALLQLATDYATLHSLQPYTNMEWFARKHPSTLLSAMREIAMGDSFYAFDQIRPTDVPQIMHGIVDALCQLETVDQATLLRWEHFMDVVEAIQRLAGDRRGPLVINRIQLASECRRTDAPTVRSIVENALAHPRRGANMHFTRPTEVPDEQLPRHERAAADFGDRPLLTLDAERFALLDHSACAPAFIESLLTQLRVTFKEQTLGVAVEEYVRAQLRSSGIAVKSGAYGRGTKNADGQCDAVVETKDWIVFIEVKKKSLTRAARSGLDIAVLADTTRSMLEALVQSGEHELHLRRYGILSLRHGNETHVIELRNRAIARIALSLTGFGGFQDKVVIDQILSGHLVTTYGSNSPAHVATINRINEKADDLKRVDADLFQQLSGC